MNINELSPELLRFELINQRITVTHQTFEGDATSERFEQTSEALVRLSNNHTIVAVLMPETIKKITELIMADVVQQWT